MNEEIRRLAESYGVADDLDLVCECETADCFAPISVAPNVYEAVRASGVRFWPRIGSGRMSIDGYCRRGVPEGTHCIRCESPLFLTGAADADAPLTRELHSTLSA